VVLFGTGQVQIETLSLDDKAQHPTEWCLLGTGQVQIETWSLDDKAQHTTEWCLFGTDCAAPLLQKKAAKLLTLGPVKGLSCAETKKEGKSDLVHLSS
jgi:hypothetical protein